MKKKISLIFVAVMPLVLFLTGCSGGVNGEGGNTYAQTSGTPVIRSDSFNDQAWDLINKGTYESAIAKFNQVLGDSPNPGEAAEANNGIGWARSYLGSLHDGMPWFEKAVDVSDDAKVGLAGAYIQAGSKADLEMAMNILYKKLGKENPHFHYTSHRKTGVTDAEVHAMLAYTFAALGKQDEAQGQLDFAKELNPDWANSTIDQISKMVDFLSR